jgi:hypothetical protein
MRAFCDSQSRISPNILLQSRALCRLLLQVLLVVSFAAGVVQRSAHAIGGSDESSTEQVNQTSATCQDAIALAARTFIQSRTAAINSCLSAFIDCDEEATDLLAETCRNNLIYLNNGACAEGVLDSGSSTAGAASLAVETKASSALIDQALITLVSSLDNGCFSGGQSSSDLSAANTGLGFSPTPATKYALADALNAIPAGVSCHSNEAVRKAYPLVDDIVSLLLVNDGKCISVSDGVSLGTTCSSNTTCGATSGRCGKIARVLKNGGDSGFPSCPVICSAGQRISVNGYSCTTCSTGTYSSTVNASTCSDCSLGHYISVSGSSTCLACAAGTYQALPGKSLCNNFKAVPARVLALTALRDPQARLVLPRAPSVQVDRSQLQGMPHAPIVPRARRRTPVVQPALPVA